jgi:hypothetical protein
VSAGRPRGGCRGATGALIGSGTARARSTWVCPAGRRALLLLGSLEGVCLYPNRSRVSVRYFYFDVFGAVGCHTQTARALRWLAPNASSPLCPYFIPPPRAPGPGPPAAARRAAGPAVRRQVGAARPGRGTGSGSRDRPPGSGDRGAAPWVAIRLYRPHGLLSHSDNTQQRHAHGQTHRTHTHHTTELSTV